MATPKQTKKVNLTDLLKGIPDKGAAKDIAGQIILDSILDKTQDSISPVEGRGKFKKLNKEYAKNFKGGNRASDLRLTGDMLGSLQYQDISENVIEIGVFPDSGEAPKADGHNNFSGKSNLPVRRFIPDKTESFKKGIMSEVESTLDLLRDEAGLEKALGRLFRGS